MVALRILYIGNFLSRSAGTKPYCESLADHLETLGLVVQRASSQASRVRRLTEMVWAVARDGYCGCPTIIDVFSSRAFVWAEVVSRIAKARGCRIILVLSGGNLPVRMEKNPSRMSNLLSTGDVVISPSRYLIGEMSHLRPDIVYLPNGLDIATYEFFRRGPVRPRMVWLRSLRGLYRPWDAVEAFAGIEHEFPDARLEIVGPDSGDGSGKRVREAIDTLGLNKKVILRGSVPHRMVPSILGGADIFMNTTSADSFGVSVMEAAACGLCIVTTDAGELSRLWQNGANALVVGVGDVKGMILALRQILMDPTLGPKLSENARSTAEEFDWSNILAMWKRILVPPNR